MTKTSPKEKKKTTKTIKEVQEKNNENSFIDKKTYDKIEKNLIKEFKKYPICKTLEITDDEIKQNMLSINNYIQREKECKNNLSTWCTVAHLEIKRDIENKLVFLRSVCNNKIRPENLKYCDYKDYDAYKRFINDYNNLTINLSPEFAKQIKNIIEKQEDKSIYLYNESISSGKTTSGFMICLFILKMYKDKKIFFVDSNKLSNTLLTNSYNNNSNESDLFIEELKTIDFLILDEIGAENINKIYLNNLKDILKQRYNSKKPTFIISNCELDKLYNDTKTLTKQYDSIVKMIKEYMKLIIVDKIIKIK